MWKRRTATVTSGGSQCKLEYLDSGGDGRVVVLLHGAVMDEQHWAPVVERLVPDLRRTAETNSSQRTLSLTTRRGAPS